MRVVICSLLTWSCFGENLSVAPKPGVLAFEARNGQYLSHGPGFVFSLNSRGAVLNLSGHAVRMSVAGASPKSSLEALDRMPGKANYLLGSSVRASYNLYGRIRRRGVYSGIDLVFRGNQQHLEYDFEVAAGRDPGRIKLAFEGVDQIRIVAHGDLVLQVGAIRIRQPKPVAYQVIAAGHKQPVEVGYRMDAANRVRFQTGVYNLQRPLVIDPEIVFDKPFGGSGLSTVAGLARDTQGNLYVAGTTNSTDLATLNPVRGQLGSAPLLVTADGGKTYSFPSLGPARSVSAIVAAPSRPMTLYAATPVGVSKSADGGTSWTQPANSGLVGPATALAVDAISASTLYAATAQGFFISTDGAASWRLLANGFPAGRILAIAAHPTETQTVFVSVQDPPALYRSTDLGQTWVKLPILTVPDRNNSVNAIAVATNGTVFAATFAQLQISTDGGITWAAGASLGVENNQALAIEPGNASTLYLVNSSGLQRSSDGGQTFTVVLPSVNSATSSQSIGPFAIDPRNPAVVYAAGFVFATGSVTYPLYRSTDRGQSFSQISLPYPVALQSLFVSPADSRVFVGTATHNNMFITKWSADGSQVLYSTYLGGSGGDQASGIAVDGTGSAYVTGFTSSPDFPTTAGAFQTKLNDASDVFVTKLSPDGSQLVYSTLIGSGNEFGAIAVDGTGNVVIAGLARGNYPATAKAFQSAPAANCINSAFNAGSAFVTSIAADGKSLRYSTLLSGSCPLVNIPVVAPAAYATGVALDANGNAWVTGATLSPDFPVTSDALQPHLGGGPYDGFLARFNPSGGLDYATYLGGSGYDVLSAIAIDPSGIYVTGSSTGLSQSASQGAFQPNASASCPVFSPGPSFPIPAGNALVLKLDPTAHSIQRLTYLGAPYCLIPSVIAVDSKGEPWIAGGYQAYTSAVQTASPFEIGIGHGFVSKFSADFTQLLFSTYFDPIFGLALDSAGLAYVAGSGPANNATGTQPVYVAKIDATPPEMSLDSVSSVLPPAVFTPGFQGIAPGEVIRILGKQIGPTAPTPGVIQSGVLATNVAGVAVTFDGVAMPLLSVSAQEIDLVAPFELAGKSATTMQVQYRGVQSNPVKVAVIPIVLQILEVFNADGSVNSASNPATAGSGMALYLSGLGQTNPPSQDGQVNAPPLSAPGMSIQLLANGNTLPVTFAGAAPGLAAGIFQVNFSAPRQSLMNVNLIFANNATLFNVWVQ